MPLHGERNLLPAAGLNFRYGRVVKATVQGTFVGTIRRAAGAVGSGGTTVTAGTDAADVTHGAGTATVNRAGELTVSEKGLVVDHSFTRLGGIRVRDSGSGTVSRTGPRSGSLGLNVEFPAVTTGRVSQTYSLAFDLISVNADRSFRPAYGAISGTGVYNIPVEHQFPFGTVRGEAALTVVVQVEPNWALIGRTIGGEILEAAGAVSGEAVVASAVAALPVAVGIAGAAFVYLYFQSEMQSWADGDAFNALRRESLGKLYQYCWGYTLTAQGRPLPSSSAAMLRGRDAARADLNAALARPNQRGVTLEQLYQANRNTGSEAIYRAVFARAKPTYSGTVQRFAREHFGSDRDLDLYLQDVEISFSYVQWNGYNANAPSRAMRVDFMSLGGENPR